MLKMKKVEIIVESLEVDNITAILESINVSGYTIIKDVTGNGGRGNRLDDELTDVFKNSYIIVVCDKGKALEIIEAIRPILKKVGGVSLLSDVHWVKH